MSPGLPKRTHTDRGYIFAMSGTLRVMSVFGTRPEAIKLAPVVLALEASPHFESVVVVTGQHREMLDEVLEFLSDQAEP